MKNFCLIILAILAITSSHATNIVANGSNFKWTKASDWSLNRVPQSGDTIIIPAGRIVTIDGQETLSNIRLKIYGTLKFVNPFSYLSVNNASTIDVYTGGNIQATIDFLQYIFVGGSTVFYAGQLNGPVMVNGTTAGFIIFNPLPVKFVGFTVAKKNTSDVLIEWSTAEELEANMYELERSYDGSNWNTIAYLTAAGTAQNLNNYSYTDKNITAKVVYYRVKQVDIDGSFTYTSVKSIKNDVVPTNADIRIASVQNKVLLQFPQEIEGTVVVRFVSLSGQVLDQQIVTRAIGQVVLTPKSSGNQIISVSNGRNLNIAKQVIL